MIRWLSLLWRKFCPPDPRHPRRIIQLWFLVAYASTSFIWMFFFTYIFEGRAYDQLLLAHLGYKADVRGHELIISVAEYHESYARLNNPHEWFCLIVTIGLAIAFVVYKLEIGVKPKWLYLLPLFVLYMAPPIIMTWREMYPDMSLINLVACLYLALFFVIHETHRFNPHLDLLTENKLRLTKREFKSILRIYQRYLLIFVGVLGFVPASFIVAASTMISNMFSRDGARGTALYEAVHMPYFEILYTLAGLPCVFLGICVIREYHEKIKELLKNAPVPLRNSELHV